MVIYYGTIKGDSRDPQWWDPLMVSFPYYSHIFRDSYGSGMGIVWEAYHKGVPLLGVSENSTDTIHKQDPKGDVLLEDNH